MNFKLLVLFSLFYSAVYATTTAEPGPEPTDATEAETVVTGETTATTTTGPTTTGPPTTTKAATTAAACVDKSTDCVNKKSLCQTTGYVGFMADLCPVSCGYCGAGATCADTRTQCAAWAKNNYCTNTFYTTETKKASCAKTCNLCSTTPTNTKPCVDTDTRCAAWNKNDYCANTFYTAADKKKGCAKTCGLC